MTSSENQERPLSASDDQTVTSATESLTTLLRKDNCTPEEISAALEYLTELKNRITDVGERQPALVSEYERYSRASEAAESQQQRLDQDIIGAKLEVSELLSERDSIAHDLARAKRALNEMNEPSRTPMSGSTIDGDSSTARSFDGKGTRRRSENDEKVSTDEPVERDDLHEQDDIEALQRSLRDDMEKLRIAEEKLIGVVDEINSTRKKRAEMQEKLKLAQEEW